MSRIDSSGDAYFGLVNSSYQVLIASGGAGILPLRVRGAASQTASMLQFQNDSGSITANFTAPVNNVNRLNLGGTDLSATLGITVHASGGVGQVIRGAASQSADLLQIQNSASTNLMALTSAGALKIGPSIPGILAVNNNIADAVVITARANSGQTVSIQEWQNSAGTVLASVSSAGTLSLPNASISSGGVLRAVQLSTNNDYIKITQANSGAQIAMTKQTAAATNPGAGLGALYFRDGTTVGTLKLVVRAGAAGAETTILDNIPQ
jgi:hypothetical protein